MRPSRELSVDSDHAAGTIKHMVGPPLPRDRDDTRDHVVVLRNITWEQYVALSDAREKSRPKLTYLDGVLEVVTKGLVHETAKSLLARLLEMYAVECDVELTGAGETTWQNKEKRAGLEADECYFLDDNREYPDLATEVVVTSGGVDKLEVYRRLGVREVWFWIKNRFWLYYLVDDQYERIRASRVVPEFDFDDVADIMQATDGNHTSAVRAYRDALRARQ